MCPAAASSYSRGRGGARLLRVRAQLPLWPFFVSGAGFPLLFRCEAPLQHSPWTLLRCSHPRDGAPGLPGSGGLNQDFSEVAAGPSDPLPSPKPDQVDGASDDSLQLDIQKLKEKRDMLDKEISQLIAEGYSVDELEDHISQLHEYNDIKDVGQMLLGKLAVIRGVTTKELYPEFDLDMDD